MIETAFIMFITFNGLYRIEIPYPTLEMCKRSEKLIEQDPSRLWYNSKGIKQIEYGCIDA